METKPKVFIVSAHAEAPKELKSAAHWTRPFYLKILLALTLLLGFAGVLTYPRFDPDTAIRSTIKINTVVYENGQGTLVKSIGVLLSADGIIVTSFRNVDDARYVWVQNSVGQTADATVIAADSSSDLALLKIEGRDLSFVRLGEPGSIKVGESVHTVGSSGGLDFSCTTGTVVALSEPIGSISTIRHDEHLIQTDLPLNSDCSGGPLFDQRGELVGINSGLWTASEGHSFAVPVALVRDLLEKYFSDKKSGGEVTSKSEAVLNNK